MSDPYGEPRSESYPGAESYPGGRGGPWQPPRQPPRGYDSEGDRRGGHDPDDYRRDAYPDEYPRPRSSYEDDYRRGEDPRLRGGYDPDDYQRGGDPRPRGGYEPGDYTRGGDSRSFGRGQPAGPPQWDDGSDPSGRSHRPRHAADDLSGATPPPPGAPRAPAPPERPAGDRTQSVRPVAPAPYGESEGELTPPGGGAPPIAPPRESEPPRPGPGPSLREGGSAMTRFAGLIAIVAGGLGVGAWFFPAFATSTGHQLTSDLPREWPSSVVVLGLGGLAVLAGIIALVSPTVPSRRFGAGLVAVLAPAAALIALNPVTEVGQLILLQGDTGDWLDKYGRGAWFAVGCAAAAVLAASLAGIALIRAPYVARGTGRGLSLLLALAAGVILLIPTSGQLGETFPNLLLGQSLLPPIVDPVSALPIALCAGLFMWAIGLTSSRGGSGAVGTALGLVLTAVILVVGALAGDVGSAEPGQIHVFVPGLAAVSVAGLLSLLAAPAVVRGRKPEPVAADDMDLPASPSQRERRKRGGRFSE